MSDFWTFFEMTVNNAADPQREDKMRYMLKKYIAELQTVANQLEQRKVGEEPGISDRDRILSQDSIRSDTNLIKLRNFMETLS